MPVPHSVQHPGTQWTQEGHPLGTEQRTVANESLSHCAANLMFECKAWGARREQGGSKSDVSESLG